MMSLQRELLWPLRQDCEDLKRFVLENEEVMSMDSAKAPVIHEITEYVLPLLRETNY